ncbi:hypothetical protein BC749_1011394 [Flavobacterium araucananum]|uniref:Uncharacterized protein n=1 Tax=Flavobacterium araucananum TaxID=946678 RepID=A0A227NUG1_9FLAO|nr:hypothetical protein [Flavobacterium araucananum]OXG00804.1 hypothetical protein B0A64_19460 [Flavobacterium araucananum]PWK03295.1 hypothetical protein BC749_1011394 [Flavobacterium araucananum]
MTFFNFLFRRSNIECPRCLGKAFVDWDDIQRLNRVLKWAPGPCAYCYGTGKVDKEMLSKVAVDYTYLTIDLPESEMDKIKEGDEETLEKGRIHEFFLDNLIQYIEHQYLSNKMDAESIANLYLTTEDETALFSLERKNLIQYIEKIIELKKSEPKQ